MEVFYGKIWEKSGCAPNTDSDPWPGAARPVVFRLCVNQGQLRYSFVPAKRYRNHGRTGRSGRRVRHGGLLHVRGGGNGTQGRAKTEA